MFVEEGIHEGFVKLKLFYKRSSFFIVLLCMCCIHQAKDLNIVKKLQI